MPDQRKAAIEAIAEALYRDSAKEQSDARTWAEMKAEHPADYEGVTRFYSRATAALDALLAVCPALGLRVVPVDPTCEMLEDGYYAARKVQRSGASGMTIEAQMRAQTVREVASYRAMIAAAPNVLEAKP